jgi:hypothetical protein
MKIKNNETVFVVVAILVLSSVLPTVTTTTTGLLSSTFYLSTQPAYASKTPLSTEGDTSTSGKQDQRQPSGAIQQPTVVRPQCDPEAVICDVGSSGPGSEGKTVEPERPSPQFVIPEQQEEEEQTIKTEQTREVIEDFGNGDTDEQQEEGDADGDIEEQAREQIVKMAPIAVSEDNIYVVWWDNQNNTDNNEVFLRASSDAGNTFGEKINVSNSNSSDSTDVDISADGTDVMVTWWERNQTAEEPVMRTSNDNGATFGPLLTLATNGTIGEATEGEEE